MNKKISLNEIMKRVLLFIIIFLSFIYLTGCCLSSSKSEVTEKTEETDQVLKETAAREIRTPIDGSLLEQLNQEINALVNKVTPSVVFIIVSVLQEDFFGNEQISEGVGSGVIYSRDGYIITNSHVAAGAVELKVILADGSEYDARLVNASTRTDIAVIKIDADNLKPATFCSIEQQNVGDFVLAVGSPFGIEQTVTTGIISGKNRNISIASDQYPIVDLIQTDAAINPGNSGGPLINIYGDVIGINTIIFSTTGSSAGVGFAIPSDTAVNIAKQIIDYGEPRIPFIGIEIGVNETDIPGVMVAGILPGTPAEKAGIKPGDIIVEFDGKKIETSFDLLTQIIRSNCGDIVDIKIYRNGSYIEFSLKLEQCPSDLS